MNIFKSQTLRSVVGTAGITLFVLGIVAPLSCRLTEEGIEIIPADTTAPSVLDFFMESGRTLSVHCSERIAIGDVVVREFSDSSDEIGDEGEGEAFAVADSVTYSTDGTSARIELSDSTCVGKQYLFSGRIYDVSGNSLEFYQKFVGFNEHPAQMIFNEIRISYDKKKQESDFVEFYVLKDGNTSGLEFVSAANGNYEFPAIEVKRGDYIVLHGRTEFAGSKGQPATKIENFADELDSDLSASKTPDSCATARDLWRAGSKRISTNTDVLVLRDSATQKIKDAVFLSASGKTEWTKTKKVMKELAWNAFMDGIWTSGENPENAICTDGLTTSSIKKTILRKNTEALLNAYTDSSEIPEIIAVSAEDWLVTTGKDGFAVTPGYKNEGNLVSAK